ncbi:MAG: ester cyclase [Dehalococcoidia bacterium]
MAEATSVGRQFFEAQDRLRGGPDPVLCAVDYTADVNGNHLDLEAHQAMAAAFYAGFPDLHHIVENVQTAEAAERVRVRAVGTHQQDFMGLPATGKPIDVSIDAIMMIEDGKVESLVIAFDQVGMLRQLGVQ